MFTNNIKYYSCQLVDANVAINTKAEVRGICIEDLTSLVLSTIYLNMLIDYDGNCTSLTEDEICMVNRKLDMNLKNCCK